MTIDAQKDTIQQLPDVSSNGVVSSLPGWFSSMRGPYLSAWGTRQRERELRDFYRNQHNAQIQGAFVGLARKIASTPWEIKGPEDISDDQKAYYKRLYSARFGDKQVDADSDIEYYQDILRNADFGRGWDSFILKLVQDYFVQDGGAFIEIIAPGNPMNPPTGPVVGLAVLDSLNCYPTGSPEYPVVYYDASGVVHVLHRTRVFQLVDAPSSDELHPGYGLSALSRAVSIAMRQINTSRYIDSRVDDKPPPGIIVAAGMTNKTREQALALYYQDQVADERPPWGKQFWLFPNSVEDGGSLRTVAFSEAPEKFDYPAYVDVDMNMLSLALGVDIQELWQLSGGSLGSGQQSEILHLKSRGKTIGGLLTQLERVLNDILPDDYEFSFTARDEQEDKLRADIAATWANTANMLRGVLSNEQIAVLLSNNVDSIRDAIRDAEGTIERGDDVDAIDIHDEPYTGDTTDDVATDTDGGPDDGLDNGVRRWSDTGTNLSAKSIQATRINFELDMEDFILQAREGAINRRRAGIVLRGLISRYGRIAYRDGLVAGGVIDGTLDDDDEARVGLLTAEQSQYVTNFLNTLYTTGVSDVQAMTKPAMWFNKSITPFFDAGRLSADKNGNYEFILGPTEKHCTDCPRLNGQIHRLRDWARKNLIPPTSETQCGGYNCKCRVVRTNERARGRFL